jgi:hypothetical protein
MVAMTSELVSLTPELRSESDEARISEAQVSAVSWAAILAGGVASAALTLALLAFGAGMGFSAVSPWSNSGLSATTVGIGAGLYLIVVAMIASSIGGYLAGRLRTKWAGVHTHEIYFRDTAHGFLAWAFATVLSAAVLTTAASHIVGGASVGLPQAAGSAAGPIDGYVDRLLRADPGTNRNAGDPGTSRNELGRLLTSSFRGGGNLNPADRTYVAQVVATHTGLSQADADKRVSDVITQAKIAEDSARKVAAHLALWLTASLLIGAFSASLAATEGGGLRDGTWKY